jgi:hypothetical protein
VVDLLVYTATSAVAATLTDGRLWAIAVSCLSAAVLAVLFPSHILLWMTLGVGIGPAVTGLLWLRSSASGATG